MGAMGDVRGVCMCMCEGCRKPKFENEWKNATSENTERLNDDLNATYANARKVRISRESKSLNVSL